MRLHTHVLVLLASALLAHSMVLCPDGIRSNCYPKNFQASNEWQPVLEGQQIPAGLHVRMNLETGLQEARLLQPEGHEENAKNVKTVNLGGNGAGSELTLLDDDKEAESVQNTGHRRGDRLPPRRQHGKKQKASESELSDYDSSVAEILEFSETADLKRLERAMGTLIELSHDLDFGLQLAETPQVFATMHKIATTHAGKAEIGEKIYRIMGASLRNNPKAIKAFVHSNAASLMPQFYRILQTASVPDVVQKRMLGVVHALSLDPDYAAQEFSLSSERNSAGLHSLITAFPHLGKSAKERVVLILEDLGLFKSVGMDAAADSADETVSGFLQSFLHSKQHNSEQQFQVVFRSLAQLHETSSLPVKSDFMHWLSKESEARKAGDRRRDGEHSKADVEFDTYLAQARHLVFGNPNAHRKAGHGL